MRHFAVEKSPEQPCTLLPDRKLGSMRASAVAHTLESLQKDESQHGSKTLFLRDDAKLDFVLTEPRLIVLLKKTDLNES